MTPCMLVILFGLLHATIPSNGRRSFSDTFTAHMHTGWTQQRHTGTLRLKETRSAHWVFFGFSDGSTADKAEQQLTLFIPPAPSAAQFRSAKAATDSLGGRL